MTSLTNSKKLSHAIISSI